MSRFSLFQTRKSIFTQFLIASERIPHDFLARVRFTSSSGAGRRPIEAGTYAAFSLFIKGDLLLPPPVFCLDARVGGVYCLCQQSWQRQPAQLARWGWPCVFVTFFVIRSRVAFIFWFLFHDILLKHLSDISYYRISVWWFIRCSNLISVRFKTSLKTGATQTAIKNQKISCISPWSVV